MTRTRSYYYLYSKPPEVLHDPGPRKCLRCSKEFKSQGSGQRTCKHCRYKAKKQSFVDDTPAPCSVTIAEISLSDMEPYW